MLEVVPFTPWVRLVDLFDVALFTLLRVAGEPSRWAWLAVVAGAVAIGASVSARYGTGEATGRVAAAAVAVLVLLARVPGVTRFVQVVAESHGSAGVGAGVYLVGLAEVALVAAVALPRHGQRGPRSDHRLSPHDG